MKNSNRSWALLLIAALCLNGCIAAVAAAPILIPAATIAGGGAVLGTVMVNSARAQHPNINFDKTYPESLIYNKDYNTAYQACLKALSELRQQTERTDKESGIIDTKKTAFGEEPGAIGFALGKKGFTQQTLIMVKKISDQNTEVSVKAKFTRKGSYTQEQEFDDQQAENVVRAIFFDKLDQLLGVSSAPSGKTPEKKTDAKEQPAKSDVKQGAKPEQQPAVKATKSEEQPQPKGAEVSEPTLATVRKAKKEQGLSGFIFQDQKSKKFYLEDNEGTTYRFDGGQWKKLN